MIRIIYYSLTYRARYLYSSALTAYYLISPPPSVCVSISNFAVPYLFKTVQRYKQYLKRANIFPKIFILLTLLNYKVYILKILIHILGTN